jgi:uncharacterized glyoxalase superfamily protein PhnB
MSKERPQLDNTAEFSSPAALQAAALMVSLTVKDLDRSVAWYRDVVGFQVDRRVEQEGVLRAVGVRAGAVRVLLNRDDGARGWDRVKGEGFALTLLTDQDIDAVATRIRACGGVLATEPADMPWGARVFRLIDPDGYRWSISSLGPG